MHILAQRILDALRKSPRFRGRLTTKERNGDIGELFIHHTGIDPRTSTGRQFDIGGKPGGIKCQGGIRIFVLLTAQQQKPCRSANWLKA